MCVCVYVCMCECRHGGVNEWLTATPQPPKCRYYVDRMVSSVEGMKVLLLDEETTQIVSTVYSQVRAFNGLEVGPTLRQGEWPVLCGAMEC